MVCSTTILHVCLCVRYKLRVLDVFGTEAIYNDDEYIKSHSELEHKASWGRLGLRLKQFYTLYRMHSTLFFTFLTYNAAGCRLYCTTL